MAIPTACLAIGLAGLVAYFSRTRNQYVVALASFAPLLIAATVLGAVVALVGRRWFLLFATVVVASVGGSVFLPLYLPDAEASATGPSLRVMQSNLMLGLADPDEVVRLARDSEIDVLTVQELTFDAKASLDAAGLAERFPYRFVRPTPAGGGGAGIYSRFPLRAERELPTFVLSNLVADVDTGVGVPLRVYSVHPVPPYPTPAALWASEMELLKTEVAASTGITNVVVSGDFNSTRSHSRFRDILDIGYEDAADRVGGGLIPTYPTDKSYPAIVGIDHVLTRGGTATSIERITVAGSDHHGLVTEIALTR